MKKRNLVFFVDALPFNIIEEEPVRAILDNYPIVKRMLPSVGYSINVHQELFSGRTPDAVGYFGERCIKKEAKRYPFFYIRNKSSWLRKRMPRLDRYSRPIWNRVLKTNTQFIPLDLLEWCEDPIPYPLIQNDKALFFNNSFWDCAIADRTGLRRENADAKAIQLAWEFVNSSDKNLFVALLDIDALGHLYGNPSSELIKASIRAIEAFHAFVQELDERDELGAAFLLSDHGMSNVKKIIELGIEYRIPKCGETWMCYYDSLYFKAWSEDYKIINDIKQELEGLPGKILSKERRVELGVTSKLFGEILFVLDEGYAFAPNFFGRGVAKAYHGYVDYGDMQQGIFVSNVELDLADTVRPLEVYDQLVGSFSEAN